MFCLVACEESQAITIELRKLGHTAFSCDLQECSGGFPEWHFKGSCLDIIDGNTKFKTCDGLTHNIKGSFDLVICHPPCTYLSHAGNKYLNIDKYGQKAVERYELREQAFDFAMRLYNCNCSHVAMENPKGYINTKFRKPDQTINPFQFGDSFYKRTCLWLRGLPLLLPDYQVPPPEPMYIQANGKKIFWVDSVSGKDRQKIRSKTFHGIARAMAWQYTNNFFISG